jgi:hypothetical protein
LKEADIICIIRTMNEDHTKNLADSRSFEERVFARFDGMESHFDAMETRFGARFDAMEARFDILDVRVQRLEAQEGKRALETKPIWERALAEILEVRLRVDDVSRKMDVLSRDVMQVRADQLRLDDRVDKLDSKPA